jgi:hypothetical protein
MNGNVHKRELERAVEAALEETDGAGRLRLVQNDAPDAAERAHPLEYDRNGFPSPQRVASFGERVRRLIRDG